MKKFLQAILVFILIISHINAGTIDPNTPDKNYISCGNDYEYVGKLCGIYEDGTFYCGSAVAINKTTVLTAAHVVKNSSMCILTIKEKQYKVLKIVHHKDFEKNKDDNCDIAICFLEDELDLKIFPDLYTEKDEVGKLCYISGYGFTGTFLTGPIKQDDFRRTGTNIIDTIENGLLICTASKQDKTDLEFILAPGDSGGGLFIDSKLAGINSCVMKTEGKPDSKYGTESGHTRISTMVEWIKDNMNSK